MEFRPNFNDRFDKNYQTIKQAIVNDIVQCNKDMLEVILSFAGNERCIFFYLSLNFRTSDVNPPARFPNGY